ncbi:hypothetical protein R8Z50_21625 [Longispora sp. K20-0274]|uniref:hypothetical protein n=1 Tax=Longispora sp. K20-0274 TaxID=3088255 RepID=UPI00399A6B70
MSVELLAGYGMRLTGLPDLTFGMTQDDIVASWRGRRRYRPFVCGMWAIGINLTGVDVAACGQELAFEYARVGRLTRYYRNGVEGLHPHEPVLFEDVDLFSWPAVEVVDFLRDSGHDVSGGPTWFRVDRGLTLGRAADEDRFTHAALSSRTPAPGLAWMGESARAAQ